MSLNYSSIGKRIRTIRRLKMITQEELAFQVDSSPAYISNIENGKKKPSLEKITLLAEALNISIGDLLYDHQDNKTSLSIEEISELIDLCPPEKRQKLLENLSSLLHSFITQ